MKHTPVLIALMAGAGALGGLASAQTPPPALVSCTRLTDPGERLRCYDNQMGAGTALPGPPAAAPGVSPPVPSPSLPAAAAPAPVTAAPVAAPATAPLPAQTPEAKFGAEDVTRAVNRKPTSDNVMVSSIASIKQIRPKVFVIALANGQVWVQKGAQMTMFFKAGYVARVEKGLFGDYRMSTAQTGEKYVVRVSRIQ